jgi:divalent metal cation (Fe/Co/Zn/Cd) transporter
MADADVMVHIEPRTSIDEDLPSRISLIALRVRGIKSAHKVEIHKIGTKTSIDLHLEVDAKLTVKEAHDLVNEFEKNACAELGPIEIHSHIETHECDVEIGQDVTAQNAQIVKNVKDIVSRYPRIKDCTDILVRKTNGKLSINMCCKLFEDETLDRAHDLSTLVERIIREETGVDHITVHIEPAINKK